MRNQETGEEPDCSGIIPAGVAAGVIVGVFVGMAIAAAGGLEAYGWEIVVGLGATTIGGGVVIKLVVWALQDDLDKTIGWWRERVQHDDEVIDQLRADLTERRRLPRGNVGIDAEVLRAARSIAKSILNG